MIDFTVLSAALNKVILPSVTRQMYEKAPAWQLFGGWNAEDAVAQRANVNVSRFENNKMYVPVRTSYHSGIVSISPGEKYQYGSPTVDETYAEIKTIVGSFQIQKALLNVTNKGAVVKPLLFSSKTLADDLAMDANRQVYGNGNGVIATTASSGSGTTVVALNPSTNGDIDYSRYLPPGTKIRITGATGGSGSAVTDTEVDSITGDNQITVIDSMTFSADVNIAKITGSNTVSSELSGLLGMVNTGSYQNLDSATVNAWKSSLDIASETLSAGATFLSKLNQRFFPANRVGQVKWLIMNAHAFQIYGNSLVDQKRAGTKEVLSGGWIGLEYMGGNAQVLLDYDCPDDTIYFLSPEDLVFGQFQPLEWEKGTDGVLFKITQQLDYEVTASWMGNLGTTARAAHAAMRNKTFSL